MHCQAAKGYGAGQALKINESKQSVLNSSLQKAVEFSAQPGNSAATACIPPKSLRNCEGCRLTSFSMKRILSLLLLLFALTAQAQDSDADGKIMLTVILRHDQTLTLDEINDHLEKTGFRKTFPPDGVEILSYNIVMGIGHIVTLRFPRPINSAKSISPSSMAFGAPSEQNSIPTYDYLKVFYDTKKKDSESGTTNPAGKEPENEKKPARI